MINGRGSGKIAARLRWTRHMLYVTEEIVMHATEIKTYVRRNR
jgi:hypothetical protein